MTQTAESLVSPVMQSGTERRHDFSTEKVKRLLNRGEAAAQVEYQVCHTEVEELTDAVSYVGRSSSDEKTGEIIDLEIGIIRPPTSFFQQKLRLESRQSLTSRISDCRERYRTKSELFLGQSQFISPLLYVADPLFQALEQNPTG